MLVGCIKGKVFLTVLNSSIISTWECRKELAVLVLGYYVPLWGDLQAVLFVAVGLLVFCTVRFELFDFSYFVSLE